MKKTFLIKALTATLLFSAVFASSAREKAKLRFMPAWITQAQFAGYYIAREKGFYDEEGLDLDIVNIPSNTSKTSLDYLIDRDVDICCSQLLNGMIFKDQGHEICCVLQTSQNSGLMCVTLKPIESISDFDGMKIGRWKAGYGEVADLFCMDHDFHNVKWIYFLHGVNLFVSGAIDATLCYSYSEYPDLLFAKGSIPENMVYRFSDLGYNYPEDAVFVTDSYYNQHKEEVDSFIRATIKGWNYAREHREETLDVVMSYVADANVKTNRAVQSMMLDEVLRLQINYETGIADFAPISRDLYNAMTDDLTKCGTIKTFINYEDLIK